MVKIKVGDSVYSKYVDELEHILGTVIQIDETLDDRKPDVYHVDFGNLGEFEFSFQNIKKSNLSALIKSFEVDQ